LKPAPSRERIQLASLAWGAGVRGRTKALRARRKRQPLARRCLSGVVPTLSALKSFSARVDLPVGSGRLADNGGWRQPRGDRERSGPACACSRRERRFQPPRVGGQATVASASPPERDAPRTAVQARSLTRATPRPPWSHGRCTASSRLSRLRYRKRVFSRIALHESGPQAPVSSFDSSATTSACCAAALP